MNTAFDIIVIALSALLAIFLILLIIVIVKLKQLVNSIKHVVEKGEQVVLSAEAAADMLKHAAGPVGTARSIMKVLELFAKHKGKD